MKKILCILISLCMLSYDAYAAEDTARSSTKVPPLALDGSIPHKAQKSSSAPQHDINACHNKSSKKRDSFPVKKHEHVILDGIKN